MRTFRSLLILSLLTLGLPVLSATPERASAATRNVVIVTIDGFRWQEVFKGADREYFKKSKDGQPTEAERRFWREDASARRAALLPFFWGTIAKTGVVFGDPSRHSLVHVTNGLWFSYPGYSEMFVGAADPRIDSNDKIPNPNVTVLEWLNARPAFRDRVLAVGDWDVLPFILNADRSHLTVGAVPPVPSPRTERERAINDLAADLPAYWNGVLFDAPIMQAALESLRSRHPRVLYVMLGETDEWAHDGRYDLYLDAAFRSDRFVERLWHALQSLPDYANQTTLLLTTDHGRGATRADWTDHGRDVPAAEATWMAMLGPGAGQPGLRADATVTTSQLAATIAALVGEDYQAAFPRAAAPLPGIARPAPPR
jgi:phosphopentomutase/2,3-bisphosphoglycerate-independent phosphoglycerate mutase family metalloenzyme